MGPPCAGRSSLFFAFETMFRSVLRFAPTAAMFALSLAARLSAVFGGSLLALFIASLAIEDQRQFASCRISASVDACLLQINGR